MKIASLILAISEGPLQPPIVNGTDVKLWGNSVVVSSEDGEMELLMLLHDALRGREDTFMCGPPKSPTPVVH